MFDPTVAIRLFHPHGDRMVEMRRQSHDTAERDPERAWVRGRTIYTCECGEQVVLTSEDVPELDPRAR